MNFKIKQANVKKNRFTVIYKNECCIMPTKQRAEIQPKSKLEVAAAVLIINDMQHSEE
jgi:hypothetical protein